MQILKKIYNQYLLKILKKYMKKMKSKEFVSDGVTQISQIYFNDMWYRNTISQARDYIEWAKKELDGILDGDVRKKLQNIMMEVIKDCNYIIAFCDQVEDFKKKKVRWVTEKLTKKIVLLGAIHQISFTHHRITNYLMHFHCEISEIINWKREPF